ncbi:hypothetical protein TKK_0001018 [Trichogramma kaykai]
MRQQQKVISFGSSPGFLEEPGILGPGSLGEARQESGRPGAAQSLLSQQRGEHVELLEPERRRTARLLSGEIQQ